MSLFLKLRGGSGVWSAALFRPLSVGRSASSGLLFAFAVSLASAEPADRISLRVVDDASATVHAVIDANLDLGVRTARLEGDAARPRVPLGPPLVVGQGDDGSNLTVVRVLNRHQVLEAQFTAFEPSVRGGVRVAAGANAEGVARIAATPMADQRGVLVRLFNRAGGLQTELRPRVSGFGRGSVHLAVGDFFADLPGDELAVVAGAARPARVLWFSLEGEPLGERSVDLPSRQTLAVSVDAETSAAALSRPARLRIHARPAHVVLGVSPGEAEPERRSLADLPADAAVWPSHFGPERLVASVDGPIQSHLHRLRPDGGSNLLDVGHLENQFWISTDHWAKESATDAFRTRDHWIRIANDYAHIRLDLSSVPMAPPPQWDQPDIWPKIRAASEARWAPLLRPLAAQPLRLWEPTMTHRMNWNQGLPWAGRMDPETGKPRFLSLTRDNQTTAYGEFGQTNQFHVFTYGYGDQALDQLYQVPLQQFLLRLAVPFRNDPERMLSLEPVHEHEVAVGGAGSVGDYHPRVIAGFHEHLRGLFGDDAALGRRFGLPAGDFDPPRNLGRGPWDAYDLANPFYGQWILYQRHLVNRRISDAFTAALAAGFPPEMIKGHQIPDTFAVGSTETFSDRKSRFTPVDYTLQAGVGFGFTRYGVFFKRPTNMLRGAATSGFRSIVMGEYQALTPDAGLAAEQLNHVFENGVTAINAMNWPAAADKGFNATMRSAIEGLLENQRPRPGLAGGTARNHPLPDRRADVAVIGTGASRTGLLKSLDGRGRWEGSVYSVPFRSRIEGVELRGRSGRSGGGGELHRFELETFDGAMQAEIVFEGAGARAEAGAGSEPSGEVVFRVERSGEALPGLTARVPAGPERRSYRFVVRNQLPADGLEIVVELPPGFRAEERVRGELFVDQVARLHRGVMEGEAHRGSLEFDVLPVVGDGRLSDFPHTPDEASTMTPSSVLGTAALALAASTASAGTAAHFTFDLAGQPEGWTTVESSRLVADGRLSGRAMTADPQLRHDGFARAAGASWDTFSMKIRELDASGATVPFEERGVVLIFEADRGPDSSNFGSPRLASEADADGFLTLTWDLSSFEGDHSGRIRLDPIGGPDVVPAGAANNRFEIDEILVTDTSAPEGS